MKSKQTCGRCRGLGYYSITRRDWILCPACKGAGWLMLDLERIAKRNLAAERRYAQAVGA